MRPISAIVAIIAVGCGAFLLVALGHRSAPEARADAPTATPTASGQYFAVDCDAAVVGIQVDCAHAPGDVVDVDVVFVNNSAQPVSLGGFGFDLHNPARTELAPFLDVDQNLNANPDAPDTGIETFTCNDRAILRITGPSLDTGADGPSATVSAIQCGDVAALRAPFLATTVIGSGATFSLGTVHYFVPSAASGGDLTLRADAYLLAPMSAVVGACGKFFLTPQLPCQTATIHFTGPSPTPTPGGLVLALDCDPMVVGIQSACDVSLDRPGVDVDVVLVNNKPGSQRISAFGFGVSDPDSTRVSPPFVSSAGLNSNPDFNDAIPGDWTCTPISINTIPSPFAQPKIGCLEIAAPFAFPSGPVGTKLATIHFEIPPAAVPGAVPLTIFSAFAYDESFSEIASCNPTIAIPFTSCLGSTITLVPAPAGTPTNTPTASATPMAPSATPTSAGVSLPPVSTPATGLFMAVDCDVSVPALQSDCTYPIGVSSVRVGLVLVNQSMPQFELSAFQLSTHDPDTSRLVPPQIVGASIDRNPDLNQQALGLGYSCSPPPPTSDDGSDGPGHAVSVIGCFGQVPYFTMPSSGAVTIATVTYNIPSPATTGSVTLRLSDVRLYSPGFSFETGGCGLALPVPVVCLDSTIHLVSSLPPTLTPTFTSSPTATAVIPGVRKIPEGNAANADLSVPKANLWLCYAPAACAGAGEGELRVVEHATNVVTGDQNGDSISDGLGAYEFSVEYDNFVIQSVNPCDIVFGPGGAGATRGAVDEMNSSSPTNTDCSPDPGAVNNGTCSMSFVLENLVRFGCVTNGQAPGPTGDFDLASLVLVPHPDLSNDIFPGNDNGVLTVIKDNGCELVDVFGHAVVGSINGGLTPVCGDLAVTVRILEGDMNLDCQVDVTDEQLISFRYGAFFGDLYYTKWHDLEPATHDLDIDIKDLQKVFGRDGSTCQAPVPEQSPLDPPTPFGD